ncbi:MAG: sugar ABC transporter substrate-binding protein [Gorillibacterium sp.]|nr:sugar ABC transporter substrate-binding protein [Gorillibacterium sp.]
MRQFWKLTVIALLIVSVISGCTKEKAAESTKPTVTEQATEVTPDAAKANDFGWVKPEKTTVIDYYHADQMNPDKTAKKGEKLHAYMLDNFNVDLKQTVFDIAPMEKLNLMLVSGEYPPVIAAMNDDTISKWQAQGKLLDLAPLVDQFGPNIKKELGSKYNSYLDKDGHLWGLPRGWGLLSIPDQSAHIRWDWYLKMNSPKIETPDDYYNVLKQMVKEHPTNAKGEKVYAISWNDQVEIKTVMGMWGLTDQHKEDADHNLTHWLNTSEGLEAVKYYNRYFREGLMDPESFLNKFDDWKNKFSNERIAGHIGPWWQTINAGDAIWSTSIPNYDENMRYMQIPLKANGVAKAYLSPKDTTGWNYTVLTDKAKNPEEIIKFLDFEMTPMGTRLMSWGIPNVPETSLWMHNSDGTWQFNDVQKQRFLTGKFEFDKTDEATGGNVFWLDHPQGAMSDDNKSTAWYDQNFNDDLKWRKMMNDNMKDTIYDISARRINFTPDNPLTIKNQQIEDAIKSGFAKAVMSKTEAESIANFNELKDKANKLGLVEITKFRTDEYKKKLEQMK